VMWEYQDSGYGIARITAYTNAKKVTAEVLVQLPEHVVGGTKTITGITQANPGVVTSNAHGMLEQHTVYIESVVGMTELNDRFFKLGTVATNTFELAGEDTTNHTAYVSGGTAIYRATSRWSL